VGMGLGMGMMAFRPISDSLARALLEGGMAAGWFSRAGRQRWWLWLVDWDAEGVGWLVGLAGGGGGTEYVCTVCVRVERAVMELLLLTGQYDRVDEKRQSKRKKVKQRHQSVPQLLLTLTSRGNLPISIGSPPPPSTSKAQAEAQEAALCSTHVGRALGACPHAAPTQPRERLRDLCGVSSLL